MLESHISIFLLTGLYDSETPTEETVTKSNTSDIVSAKIKYINDQ